jgi:hypothetical protein
MIRYCVSYGNLEWEDPSLGQSFFGLGRLEGSPCTLPRLWRVGLCDKDGVLDLLRCFMRVGGFRARDALEVVTLQ